MKVAAIVPALNEEGNIANVLSVLLRSKDVDEVIVIDDGSTDGTAQASRKTGARVITLPKKGGSGKGNAMRQGVNSTDAEIIAFFDADLINLQEKHISDVIGPVKEEKAEMCVGMRVRYGGAPELIIKLDPLLAIGGERAMKRKVFENIPDRFIKGFAVETALNYYCLIKKLPIKYVRLEGLNIIIKEKKWGFWKGFKNRIKMFWELFKIRVTLRLGRREFK
jgi:glycosyltransferase involved in cell wall biosynthesis